MRKTQSLSFCVCETLPHFVFQARGSYALQFEIRKDPLQTASRFLAVSVLQTEQEFELGLCSVRDAVFSYWRKWEQVNSS